MLEINDVVLLYCIVVCACQNIYVYIQMWGKSDLTSQDRERSNPKWSQTIRSEGKNAHVGLLLDPNRVETHKGVILNQLRGPFHLVILLRSP